MDLQRLIPKFEIEDVGPANYLDAVLAEARERGGRRE
jgi:hypothetical protein